MMRSTVSSTTCPYFIAGFKRGFTRRGSWFVLVINGILQIMIITSIWKSLLASSEAFPYELDQLILYSVITQSVVAVTTTRIVREIAHEIEFGTIEVHLVRPTDVALAFCSMALGRAFFNLSTSVLPALILAISFKIFPRIPVQESFILPVLLVFLACLIIVVFDVTVGLLSFWSASVFGIELLKDNLIRVFSGAVIPLSFYPDAMVKWINILPFHLFYYSPVNAIVQQRSPADMLQICLFQLGWLIALIALCRFVCASLFSRINVAGG